MLTCVPVPETASGSKLKREVRQISQNVEACPTERKTVKIWSESPRGKVAVLEFAEDGRTTFAPNESLSDDDKSWWPLLSRSKMSLDRV